MEVHEVDSDVLPGFGVCQNPGSRVLYVLVPVQGFAGHPEPGSITVVQTECTHE